MINTLARRYYYFSPKIALIWTQAGPERQVTSRDVDLVHQAAMKQWPDQWFPHPFGVTNLTKYTGPKVVIQELSLPRDYFDVFFLSQFRVISLSLVGLGYFELSSLSR